MHRVSLISINRDLLPTLNQSVLSFQHLYHSLYPFAIHFLWLRGASNKQIMSQIKETYEDVVIHVRSVQRWTHDFAAGRTELDALARLDWPIDPENANRIRELLESECDISQKTLSRRLNLHRDTVRRILGEEFGLCKVNFKGITHSLIESHKHERLRISMGSIQTWRNLRHRNS